VCLDLVGVGVGAVVVEGRWKAEELGFGVLGREGGGGEDEEESEEEDKEGEVKLEGEEVVVGFGRWAYERECMGCSGSSSYVMIAMLTTHCSEVHYGYKTKGCECWLRGQYHCVSNGAVMLVSVSEVHHTMNICVRLWFS